MPKLFCEYLFTYRFSIPFNKSLKKYSYMLEGVKRLSYYVVGDIYCSRKPILFGIKIYIRELSFEWNQGNDRYYQINEVLTCTGVLLVEENIVLSDPNDAKC